MEMRLGFFPQRELHLPVLLPVLDECIKRGFECTLVIAPFQNAANGIPDEGISGEQQKTLIDKYPCTAYQINLAFDLTISADFVLEYTERWGKQICLGHGTISKNIYFLNEEICWRESFHETLIVPGPAYKDSFKGCVHTEVQPLGFPKIDSFTQDIQQEKVLRDSFTQLHPNSQGRQLILVAPTHNQEFNCIDFICHNFSKISSHQFHFIFKLHGATQPNQREQVNSLIQLNKNITLWNDQNINQAMVISDAMISDLSSVCLEYYLLNKPIMVYDHPELSNSSFYHPNGIEFQFRSSSYRFQSIEKLRQIFTEKLRPDPMFWAREKARSQLFPPLDGSISNKISEFLFKKMLSANFKEPRYPLAILIESAEIKPIETTLFFKQIQKAYYTLDIVASASVIETLKSTGSHLLLENCRFKTLNSSMVRSDVKSIPEAILYWNLKDQLPWQFDLLWDVSQHYKQIIGRIDGLNELNYRAKIGSTLNMSEEAKQRFLKYRGFPKFVPSIEGLSVSPDNSFILSGVDANNLRLNQTKETPAYHQEHWHWLGLYLIK
mgnify:CR=1 FL=1|tara:strand:+ start:1590 stop:3245 length:1656 start_codon:yes stop_codon:yes gene_type:complete